MGFCIFNNIAVAAAYLLEENGVPRIAIVDWDVHHGNGTERMFLEDDRVLYISLHQYPHYPGTGHSSVVGRGRGAGFTINLPMGAGAGEREYMTAFRERVVPAIDRFEPAFILVSAGFDGHAEDPLAGTLLSTSAYGRMTTMVRECAERHCGGKIVSLLEGGYDLVALADSAEAHVEALL